MAKKISGVEWDSTTGVITLEPNQGKMGPTGPMGPKGTKGDPGPMPKLVVSGNGIGLTDDKGMMDSWVPLDQKSYNTFQPPSIEQNQVSGLGANLSTLQYLINEQAKVIETLKQRVSDLEKWTQI